jgi:carboxymethylenebutenolidase
MARREEGRITLPDGGSMAYTVVLPEGSPPAEGWPGVVVLYEFLGLAPEILAVGDRFAERGWAAFIPDYLSAGRRLGCLVRAGQEVRSGRQGPLTATLAASARACADRPDVDGARMAVIGFCIGGGLALLLGTVEDLGLRAVSANYGDVPRQEVLATSPPVVASYGGRDLLFRGKADVLRRRLDACGVANDVEVYPEAGHSFMTEGRHPVLAAISLPMRLGHVPEAAEDAWKRVFAWLDRYAG